jgi:hypothetical protein
VISNLLGQKLGDNRSNNYFNAPWESASINNYNIIQRRHPLGFIMPHYFYIYYISSNDFAVILDSMGWNLLICIGVLVQMSSRFLVLASFGGGNLLFKCPSPETLRTLQCTCNVMQFSVIHVTIQVTYGLARFNRSYT